MKKFIRVRKDTDQEVEMFGTEGKIVSISEKGKENKNGKLFYNFVATIEMPRGPLSCLGQVYEASFEYLGGKPKTGDSFAFAAEVVDLENKNNKVWSISGTTVDEISDDLLSDLDNL